jgi:hypothetical protein
MRKTLAVAVACVAALAFAGKPERDKQKELTPKIAERAKNIKAACGCEVKITPKWDTYKKADDMGRIDSCAEAFETALKQHCESPEDKKALCENVKELHIAFAADIPSPAIEKKVITAHSNDMSYNGDGQFTEIVSKF